MPPRSFSAQRLVLSALVVIAALAAIPIGLCVSAVTELRSSVAQINKAGAQAKQARDVVDKVGQSVFSFTAVALKLSPEERDSIFAETDEHLRTFEHAVHAVAQWSTGMLPAADRERLDGAIQSVAHSWEEIRALSGAGISEAEETYHFLKIVGDTKAARDILVALEGAVTQAAERASAHVFERLEQTGRLLILVMLIGCALTGCAASGVYFFARRLRQTNRSLERMNEGLRLRDERFSAALSNMPHGLCMFDGQARLIICNELYAAMYDLPPHLRQAGTTLRQIIDHRLSVGTGPADPSRLFCEDLACLADGAPTHQKLETQDGRTIRISHQPLSGGGWVATHEDVTDAIKTEARIAYMAHHDALTGLPNRALFREEMERALTRGRQGEQSAVLCLDLDHFKAVNDTLGHPVGDALLQEVATRLQGCISDADTVARLGGDEFAVVQVGVEQPGGATALAQRIIDRLSAPYNLDGHHVVIGTSVGVAITPTDGRGADQLLKYGDMALYRAKSDGRGMYRFFDPEMDARLQARRRIEIDLHQALACGGFEVFYQPIFDAQTHQVCGFEALARWPHPERGMVSPAEFIPVAEETGLIVPIGEWVLRRACAEAATWPAHVKVAVNLSPVQFRNRSLVQTVVNALAAASLAPSRLELEITESVMLHDTDATLATLQQLRGLGVNISLDDFGTGYSSLSYLRKFPFDKLKIDQSFVRELSTRPDCAAIVSAVSNLGARLHMTVVAEGVETERQLEQLRGEGCAQVQAYLLGRPKPAGEVTQMFAYAVSALEKVA